MRNCSRICAQALLAVVFAVAAQGGWAQDWELSDANSPLTKAMLAMIQSGSSRLSTAR